MSDDVADHASTSHASEPDTEAEADMGQAPDNPFYMQLVRNDGTGIEVIVSLTDPNYQRAGEEAQNASATSTSSDDEGSNLLANGVIGLGIVILLIIIGFIIRKVSNRRKQDQYEY